MEKALVTGGGGFIGLAVVQQLTELGVKTTILGRNPSLEASRLGARCLQGDIRDRQFVMDAVRGNDTLFHVAARAGIWGSWNSYFSINVQGTLNVLDACIREGVRTLVYTSTPSVVFNGYDLSGTDETAPYASRPLCHYARTKIMAEQAVLKANCNDLRTTALRPHLVWGPGDNNLIPRLLARGRQKSLRIVGDGLNMVDISYIDNVAEAHVLAARNLETNGTAGGRPFFISQGQPVILWQWINELFARIGIAPVTRRVSFKNAYRAGWLLEKIYSFLCLQGEPKMTRFLAEQLARTHWFSIAGAKSVLGYLPKVSTAEGIDRLANHLNRQNRSTFSG